MNTDDIMVVLQRAHRWRWQSLVVIGLVAGCFVLQLVLEATHVVDAMGFAFTASISLVYALSLCAVVSVCRAVRKSLHSDSGEPVGGVEQLSRLWRAVSSSAAVRVVMPCLVAAVLLPLLDFGIRDDAVSWLLVAAICGAVLGSPAYCFVLVQHPSRTDVSTLKAGWIRVSLLLCFLAALVIALTTTYQFFLRPIIVGMVHVFAPIAIGAATLWAFAVWRVSGIFAGGQAGQ